MIATRSDTESVVRNHLKTFMEQRGVDAILQDYDDDARLLSEGGTYRGKRAIRSFFETFLGSLRPGAIGRFSLRTLSVEGEVAYISWSIGDEIALGTDTFVVRGGRIVVQTVAIHATVEA